MIVEVTRVGHLGVCIGEVSQAAEPDSADAGEAGKVVLVRHALPGELVRIAVTDRRSSYLRGDAVEILRPSPDRVTPPCRFAGPGRCGGCDWQHVSLVEQRRLKSVVVAEQLQRLAGLSVDVAVEAVPGDVDGLEWRTRLRLTVDRRGRAGLLRHRSHAVEPIDDCLIAAPSLDVAGAVARSWRPRSDVELPLLPSLSRTAGGRTWQVPDGGFWQVHPGAADALVECVSDFAGVVDGDRILDLYAGVGLFAGALAAACSAGPSVMVEASPDAAEAAVANLAGLPVAVIAASVEEWIEAELQSAAPNVVVLDPPRRGAGVAVVTALAAVGPRVIVYVACDPSALGRDTGALVAAGYQLVALRAFDAFPMTSHVETVAAFRRSP